MASERGIARQVTVMMGLLLAVCMCVHVHVCVCVCVCVASRVCVCVCWRARTSKLDRLIAHGRLRACWWPSVFPTRGAGVAPTNSCMAFWLARSHTRLEREGGSVLPLMQHGEACRRHEKQPLRGRGRVGGRHVAGCLKNPAGRTGSFELCPERYLNCSPKVPKYRWGKPKKVGNCPSFQNTFARDES